MLSFIRFQSLRILPKTLLKSHVQSLRHNGGQFLRLASTKPLTPSRRSAAKIADVMVVFNAGKWPTTLLGTTKIATIIVFVFTAAILAPRAIQEPNNPWYVGVTLAVVGAIPMVVMYLYSRQYVLSVYLRVPLYARASAATLGAFTKNVPASTRLDITTSYFIPVPRTQSFRLGELRKLESKFGRIANLTVDEVTLSRSNELRRRDAVSTRSNSWFGATRRFCVPENRAPADKQMIWDRLWWSIKN